MKAGLVNDSTLFPFKMINKTNFIHILMKVILTNNYVPYVWFISVKKMNDYYDIRNVLLFLLT